MLLALEEHLVLIVVLDPVSHDQILLLFFNLSYSACSTESTREIFVKPSSLSILIHCTTVSLMNAIDKKHIQIVSLMP